VLPKADKRNYEAKPPVEHSPLRVPGSTRIAAIFSWLVYFSDVACMRTPLPAPTRPLAACHA
jgi:hypothetical protein